MATNHSLRAVREQILISFAEDIIDAEDFVLLYNANKSKAIYPYWKYEKFDIGVIDDEQSFIDFRFGKNDLYTLLDVLNIPEKVICIQGTACKDIEALCILLKRLAFPTRYSDMTPMFGRNMTETCLIYNKMIDHIYAQHAHRLNDWNQPMLTSAQLKLYANAIHQKGAPLRSCFGFVDGTVRRIARPKNNQRQVYNGHKRVHGLKFQNVTLPNGMIGNLVGPYEGRRHDSFMLADSGLLTQLQQHAWYNNTPLCIYGDPAYPLSVHLQAPFRGAALNQDEKDYNKAMSGVRVTVEWLFGLVSNYFKFIDFKKMQRIGMSPVGKVYIVCSILQNAHTCLYGNQISETFGIDPPTVREDFQ